MQSGEVQSAGGEPITVGSPPPRVLVVDDDAAIRAVLVKFLHRAGYEVEAFEKGADLLRSIRAQRAALVITDIFMPETDGMELLMALRKLDPRPKVITISGGNMLWSTSMAAAKQLGAVATLAKPFTLADLLATVRSSLAGSAKTTT